MLQNKNSIGAALFAGIMGVIYNNDDKLDKYP